MASTEKPKSGKKAISNVKDVIQQQDVLQAVVVTDSFNDHFSPLTSELPIALFPVVNKTVLDYILEALAESGIQETFVFCCSHSKKIRQFCLNWSNIGFSPMTVTVYSSESFMSLGDVLRELDTQAVIRSDFVFVNGAVITTLPLVDILNEHTQCRQKDKGCAITLIYREAMPKHKSRCREDDVLLAVESNSKKIRYYQKIKNKRTLNIPLEVFQENDEVTVHYDVLDCHISICSAIVPPLYTDNFDYQTFDDLVRGLIINEEILGNSMYLHLAKNCYGASIPNMYMYDAVSRDIIRRWSYPLVPDLFMTAGCKFRHLRHNIYNQNDVNIGRNSVLQKNLVIAQGTKIGDNVFITDSVIGYNCHIGDNVQIKGAYLWNNVTVGNNCVLEKCLLADNVILQDNVKVTPGCVLSHKVVIGDNICLPPLTTLQSEPLEDEDSFDEDDSPHEDKKSTECDANLVGVNGLGYLCSAADSNEEEVIDVWGQTVCPYDFDQESDSVSSSAASRLTNEQLENMESSGADDDDDTVLFYNEVLDSLQRGVEEKIKSENLILEINSSKYAYNVTMKEVNTLVMKAIFKLPCERKKAVVVSEYFAELKPMLVTFVPLISNYIKSVTSQLDCLSSLEEFITSNDDLAPAAMKILHLLYEKEILNENVILKWYGNITSEKEKFKKHVAPFVTWLQEADEESSDED